MKFNFKIQQYQTDAVDAVVKVFQGQGYHDRISYIRDVGKKQENQQMRLNVDMDQQYSLDMGEAHQLNIYDMDDDTGYKNEVIELSDEQLLINIQKLQSQNNIKQSKALVKDLGRCSLDIEMETGTGKTYVYIKTMFELNKKYGWSKFIVVVPSIAIREGVKKSFEITADHFMEYYGKKARFFVYNSSNLNQLCMTNLAECFIELEHRFPVGNYGMFSVLEDYGIRYLSYRTSGGWTYNSVYRSILIQVDDVTEFISFGFNIYSDDKTILAVAIDDPDMTTHHALQLTVDNSLSVIGNRCLFTHSGRIALRHLGSGRISELKSMIENDAPELMQDGKIVLGEMNNDCLWYMDTEQVVSFLTNLIKYALIRDKYRKSFKEKA